VFGKQECSQIELDMAKFEWQEEIIRMFGKTMSAPRKSIFFGDQDISYRYAGKVAKTLPWPPVVSNILGRVQQITGCSFNAAVCNRYGPRDMIGRADTDGGTDHCQVRILTTRRISFRTAASLPSALGKQDDLSFKPKMQIIPEG
jgi:alkylated DNA repair dioxygenase AlkB